MTTTTLTTTMTPTQREEGKKKGGVLFFEVHTGTGIAGDTRHAGAFPTDRLRFCGPSPCPTGNADGVA